MYEVKKSKVVKAGKAIPVWSRVVHGVNDLKVDVGTTGLKGGDWSYGGRAFLKLTDVNRTDMDVWIERDKERVPLSVELTMFGDSETLTLLGALKFAVSVLEDQLFKEEVSGYES